jgi:hypothetical protein
MQASPVIRMPECGCIPLKMWNGDDILVRRDMFDVLTRNNHHPLSSLDAPVKMLVGIITSDLKRVRGLISDLGCMLADAQHCVVVFANDAGSSVAEKVKGLLNEYSFRSHVIRSNDRIVRELSPDFSLDATSFPLPIALARTVLQTYLLAITRVEHFEAAAVVDDDIRLPKAWGIRKGDDEAGDILLSRAIKTPPNPTVMSMRTQLWIFLCSRLSSSKDQEPSS